MYSYISSPVSLMRNFPIKSQFSTSPISSSSFCEKLSLLNLWYRFAGVVPSCSANFLADNLRFTNTIFIFSVMVFPFVFIYWVSEGNSIFPCSFS